VQFVSDITIAIIGWRGTLPLMSDPDKVPVAGDIVSDPIGVTASVRIPCSVG
jgi:hypothetical protein